ncbi:MAG TPA: bifunctional UDP-N-acetylmuramoyl-tripeptide:D-alanyl-D-alanine ligase/alanine racemase [Flavipsychrobacter sp.]|mgnify:CR=1 FL=1|nr:bifunctional UDP-N-acetylmuramoyl-tripeptide:D-alanyl-D-alanine ligase/alanine racemase [Flavipsychrobacter sp.]
MVSIEQLYNWSHGTWLAFHETTEIDELIIDSRKINKPEHALFIALATARRDGHSFIESAYEKGIRNFLVHEKVDTTKYPAANFLLVGNTLQASQQIVGNYRKQFHIPVIGITGSNGKTIVKEWLYELLSDEHKVIRSPKSFNSQIGVPLSVWLLEKDNDLAIFEAGISHSGEMEHLEKIIQPTIGIFTNIGEAHSEGFLNQRQKINEKLVLFRNAKQLIYCIDYPELNECIVQYRNQLKRSDYTLELFTWSQKNDANLKITSIEKHHNGATIEAIYNEEVSNITIPFSDPASIENAIHCWCAMLLLGKNQNDISNKMHGLHPVAMRLELLHGINDCTIINDTYNSDLTSLQIALDFLDQQKQHTHHTVILSDLLQIGKPDSELYEEVASLVSRRGVQRFIGVGAALFKHKSFFRAHKKLRSIFFKTTEEFLQKFHLLSFENEAVLLKGARTFKFEKVGLLLEQKVHQTVLSINLSALTHNLNVFREQLKPGVKTMAMVKAFSYGSGSFEIAHLLQFSGVDYLTVAYTDEGIALRKAGITMPIMVMSPDIISFDRMIAWKLEPEIYNLLSLQSFLDMAKTLQVSDYPVHIKLDTGMHRLGFMQHEIAALNNILQHSTTVKVASIFSHLAASEDASFDDFTKEQTKLFQTMGDEISGALGYAPLKHLCNSAAIGRHPALHFDMVRLGIGLYGIDSSSVLQSQLKQVSTLRTTIAQIKEVRGGQTVGYGRKGLLESDKRIATICIGYADGYPRSLGNGNAHVLLHGKKAKLIGVVCMDMCMIDVTDIPEAKEGDDVIVFGPNLPVTQLAKWAGTISYEIMTGISQRVKRVYVNEE